MRQITLLLALLTLLTPELRAAEAFRAGDTFEWRLTGMPADVVQDIAQLQFTIGPEGTVNIPLIGKVKAIGLNATQLSDAIEAKFIADKIFTRPTVIINPTAVQRFVSVSGGVRAPQRLIWTADMTLTSAVGNAGGVSDFGNPNKIILIREGKRLGPYSLKELGKDPSRDPKLLPGDQVNVPE
jgi:protein involved in polysaccharide export with SLBB domain